MPPTSANRQALVATLAAAIGCEPWDPSESVHDCVGVSRAVAGTLLRGQPHQFETETPDAEDGGTLKHIVTLMHHAVVTLIVSLPAAIDGVEHDAQVTVMVNDHEGEPSEDMIAAYQYQIEMLAQSAAIRQMVWLRGLEPSQLVVGLRAICSDESLAHLSRLLAPGRLVGG